MVAKRTACLALVFALFFISASSSQALAAKPDRSGGSGSGSVALVLLQSVDGLAHYGQNVTFAIATSASAYPYVNLKCWQGGAFVGEAWRGFFPTSLSGTTFTLSGTSAWQSGVAADCSAYLTYQTRRGWTVVASTSFHVDP